MDLMNKYLSLTLVLTTGVITLYPSSNYKAATLKEHEANTKALEAVNAGDTDGLHRSIQQESFDCNYRYPDLNNRTLLAELCFRSSPQTVPALKTVLHHIAFKVLRCVISSHIDHDTLTPLHHAVCNPDPEILRALLSCKNIVKLDLNCQSAQNGMTAVNLAVSRGHRLHILLLVRDGSINPNIPSKELQYPLHNAIQGMYKDMYVGTIKDLVELGADVECKNTRGQTPLELCYHNIFITRCFLSLDRLFELLAVGGQIKEEEFEHVLKKLDTESLLFSTVPEIPECRTFLINCVESAVKNGSYVAMTFDPNNPNSVFGMSQQLWYASSGHKLVAHSLIVNAQDKLFGMTGLMWAAARGNLELTERLIHEGAEPLLVDKWGDTALHHAVRNGHMAVVEYLKDYAPKAYLTRNLNGRTPVDVAISSKKSPRMLLKLAK